MRHKKHKCDKHCDCGNGFEQIEVTDFNPQPDINDSFTKLLESHKSSGEHDNRYALKSDVNIFEGEIEKFRTNIRDFERHVEDEHADHERKVDRDVRGFQSQLNSIARGATNAETSQGRVRHDGEEFDTLKERLDYDSFRVDNSGIYSIESFAKLPVELDDTGRLQRAINDPKVFNLLLKRNTTYRFTSLNLKPNFRIYGEDRGTSILRHIGSGIAIKNANVGAIGNVILENFSLELNSDSTIGIEFARVHSSKISFINVIGKESTGIGISFDDGAVNSAYYNSCYDVSINGYLDGARQLSTGFKFANSSNSNRLFSCRTNYVKTAVDVATDYCNHIVIIGCAFEQFDTGVRLNGDICQIIACRFENSGGSANGVGIEITPTSGSNTIIGNTITNILTPLKNDNPTGSNHILDYGSLSVKYFSHETDGGWRTNQDMRNYGINNTGFLSLQSRTNAPATMAGRLTYANGTDWDPGYKSGLYVSDGSTYRRINYHREGPTSSRPSDVFRYTGMPYFDTTVGKPIWFNGTRWIDSAGNAI